MHHAVQKGPEQHVGEETPDQAPREQQPSGLEALIPPPTGLQYEQQGEQKRGEKVEDEAIEAGEAQNPGGGSGQGRH